MKEKDDDSASLLCGDPSAAVNTEPLPISQRYQLRRRYVDAVLWDETHSTLKQLVALGMRWSGHDGHRDRPNACTNLRIFTKHMAGVGVRRGEWIVRDEDGYFNPYRADVFEAKYEPIGSGTE